MSVVAPKLFLDTDTGGPTLSGTTGDLIEVISSCAIIRKMFTAISGGSFVDNTTEARLQGGTAFKLFQGPTVTNDEAYFGLTRPFERLALVFGTAGVQNAAVTLAWEYWNGSAWTALTVVDGTSGLTANGAVTWTPPADWAANAVNSSTIYWIRVRFTAGSWTTNPLVNTSSIVGWTIAFTGTNQVAYQQGGGNNFFLNVNDNGPGAGGAKEARVLGYEAMTAVGTGTNPFPTAAQFTNGLFFRKSTAASGTTRQWFVVCDDRTMMVGALPADTNSCYTAMYFGDIYSAVSGDAYRTALWARTIENTAVTIQSGNSSGSDPIVTLNFVQGAFSIGTVGSAGGYIARPYTGVAGATNAGLLGDIGKTAPGNSNAGKLGDGVITYPNPADGGVYISPVWIQEAAGTIRGRARGMWHWCHPYNSVSDRITFSGTGAFAGKSFILLRPFASQNVGAGFAAMLIETSDTWETN